MKKRIMNIFGGVAMLALSAALMAGCSGNGGKNETTASPAPTQTAATSTPAPTAEPTPASTVAPTQAPTAEPTQEPVSLENAAITDGVFWDKWTPQSDEYISYFHFYPSGVFYLSLYSGLQYQAGFYELVDKEIEYVTDKATGATAKADQAVVLTNLDGSPFQTLAYTDHTVWNLPTFYEHNFVQELNSGITEADETGITVTAYMLGDDDYSLVELKHNGTFQDSVDTIIDGTWAKNGDVYTLTDGDSGASYTLSINADNTATYKGLDGTAQTLNLVKAKEAIATFTGSTDASYGTMGVAIDCFDDGSAAMTISYAGTENVTEGTWRQSDDQMKLILELGGATYEAALNMADYSFAFEFTSNDGVGDVTFNLSTATAAEATVLYTWRGEQNDRLILECYTDNTCAMTYTGIGPMGAGTWAIDTSGPLPKFTISLEGLDEIVSESDYATKFFFTFTDASGQLTDNLSLTFEDWQAAAQ